MFLLVGIVRFGEGLVNNLMPPDIYRLWGGILLGGLVSFGLAGLALLQLGRLPRSQRSVLVGGLCWMVVFTVYAVARPGPRTLYVPTLGLALAISVPLTNAERGLSLPRRAGLVLLTLYLGMHLFLGKSVAHFYAPGSPNAVGTSAVLLRSGNIGGDRLPDTDEELALARQAYRERELLYLDVDGLTEQPYRFEPGPRRFMRR